MRRLFTFILLSYIPAYILDIAVAPYIFAVNTSNLITGIYRALWGLIRMYIPFLSLYIVSYMYSLESFLDTLKRYVNLSVRSIKWFFISPIIIYLPTLLTITLSSLYLNRDVLEPFRKISLETGLSSVTLSIIILLGGYIAALSINSIYAFGEEAGWRGFMYEELARYGLVNSGIMIGIVWGLWHFTIIALPTLNNLYYMSIDIIFYILFTILLSILLNIIRGWSESILPVVSLHGAVNAIWNLTKYIGEQENLDSYIIVNIFGILSWIIVTLIIYMLYRMSPHKYN